MRWSGWRFSAQLALQDAFIRWTTVAIILVLIAGGSFFIWRLFPIGWHAGVVTFHYNVYLGIDDVRPWPWLFAMPVVALGMMMVDVLFAFGIFRHHALAGRALILIGLLSLILWVLGSFFLILVNV